MTWNRRAGIQRERNPESPTRRPLQRSGEPLLERRTVRRMVSLATYTAMIVALAGVIFNVWGILWVWVAAAISLGVSNVLLVRLNEALLADLEHLVNFTAELHAQVAVTCAGCRVRTTIAPTVVAEGPPNMIGLPRGWEVRDRRTYCPTCLARTES